MTTQPEALRLADKLNLMLGWDTCAEAAAELRRLYDLAMEQQGKIYALEMARSMEQKTAKLKRDALLEALKTVEWHGQGACWVVDADKIAAAIKAAEENA